MFLLTIIAKPERRPSMFPPLSFVRQPKRSKSLAEGVRTNYVPRTGEALTLSVDGSNIKVWYVVDVVYPINHAAVIPDTVHRTVFVYVHDRSVEGVGFAQQYD